MAALLQSRRRASPVYAHRAELGYRCENLRTQRLFRLHHLGRRARELLLDRCLPQASQLPRSQARDRLPCRDVRCRQNRNRGKSSGTQLIQDLHNDGVWKVVEYKPPPGADKIMRLHACSDRFESGRVVLPRNAPWLDEYILELIGFPGTKHDDQVDSTTQALDYLREPDLVATYVKAFLG